MSEDFKKLPPIHEIDRFLEAQGLGHGVEQRGRIEDLLAKLRKDPKRLAQWERQDILTWLAEELSRPVGLRPVINATGTLIHTNLGRSPLSPAMVAGLPELLAGYCNLEYDLEAGKRGQRVSESERLICRLTGAEAALFVNNNAAALLLCLQVFAQGKEVLLSRGEMVEIGGSFRVPEMLEASGAKLKELGTTNKTHLRDFQNATGPETAVLLKVHKSNFKITGFTSEPSRKELVALAKEKGLIYIEDLGSGSLQTVVIEGKPVEPGLKEILAQGAPLVCASGDKLLGGPQAGLILGRADLVERLAKHPLYRCLRCDKTQLYLLERCLLAYARGERVPTQAMLSEPLSQVEERAQKILFGLDPQRFRLVKSLATPGGGTLPEESLPSWAIGVQDSENKAEVLAKRLRDGEPPLIGRIEQGILLIDAKCIQPHQLDLVNQILKGLFD